MNIILLSLHIFILINIRILSIFNQISTLNHLQCERNNFSPVKPIVNTFIIAIILAFFTNGKKSPNFIQVLNRMHTVDDKDMGSISTLVQNFPKQARVPSI